MSADGAQGSWQACRRSEDNGARFAAEVRLGSELVKSARFGRFDDVIKPSLRHFLLISHARSSLLKDSTSMSP